MERTLARSHASELAASAAVAALVLLAAAPAYARDETASSSPISVVGQDEIESLGGDSVTSLLTKLPACPVPTGSGAADPKILVLLNGRRPGGAGSGIDLGSIPTSSIDRIEVLKDGASAIYGSDACSGVVNLILKKDSPVLAPGVGSAWLGEALDVLGGLRVGYDLDSVCDFGPGAPTSLPLVLPRFSGLPEFGPGSWTWAPNGDAAPAAGGDGWRMTPSGGEPAGSAESSPGGWPRAFEGWRIPPWSLVQRTSECPESLRRDLEPLYEERDQARADWAYFSDLAAASNRAPTDLAADRSKADDAQTRREGLETRIRTLLDGCSAGASPRKETAATGVSPAGAKGEVIDTLRISIGSGPKGRFDVYPLDYGASWPLPGPGVEKDTALGAGEGPLRGVVGGGRWASFPFTDLGRDPLRIPAGIDAGVGGSDAFGMGLRLNWAKRSLDLSLDYAPQEQRVVALGGKGSGVSVGSLSDFPKDVLSGIPFGLRPHLRQGFGIGKDLYLTFGWPESSPIDAGLFKKIPGYTSDEGDVCAEEARPPVSAGRGADAADVLARVGLGSGAPAAGSPVVVGVVDTGIDWNHLDLEWSSLWRNERETPGNGIDDDGNGYVDDVIGWDFVGGSNAPWDYDGHGTFVAGLIAASPENGGATGVSPAARIMVLKALNGFGHTRASAMAQAVVYGADNGARIVNVSVAGDGMPRVLQAAIRYAESKGVLVIVAAGNDGKEITNVFPASLPGVMTVAATDSEDARAAFSNFGEGISVAAPGTELASLRARRTDFQLGRVPGYAPGASFVGSDRRYYRASGTSFAAPIVAGVASLVWSKEPALAASDVRERLEQTARDVAVPGRDHHTGFGIVDAGAALSASGGSRIVAEIERANPIRDGGTVVIEVIGTAKADRFKRAWLELGEGESPATWKKVAGELSAGIESAPLGRIPAADLAGAKVWTLRLVVEDETGRVREVRYVLRLG